MQDKPLSKTYRSREVTQILSTIQAGDSCTMIGIGSAGKSNLLRFLQRPDILQDRLGAEWDRYLLIYVDGNKLIERSPWGLMELMLHQTMIALQEHAPTLERGDDAHEIVDLLDKLYDKTIQVETRTFAVRYLDRALHLVCKRLGLRPVFLLDEFDALYKQLPAAGFSALRALRDDHKYQLTYLVAARLEWSHLREQEHAAIEAFEELVSPHTIWLGPYAEPDAREMLDRLTARYRTTLTESTRRSILLETGGHPGLVRAAYQIAVKTPQHLGQALRASTQIQDECRRIWYSLHADEQQVVAALAATPDYIPPAGPALVGLQNKRLVLAIARLKYALFSELFGDCIIQLNLHTGTQISIDHDRRSVQVGEKRIENLSPLPFKLLDYLLEHRGQSCSHAELAHHLYPNETYIEGVSSADGRLHTIVTRLRKEIEPDPGNPQYVLSVRGYGYRLADG